jgi:CDGSH-type Zn-finger protein
MEIRRVAADVSQRTYSGLVTLAWMNSAPTDLGGYRFEIASRARRLYTRVEATELFMAEPIIFQKSPIVQKVEPGTYWWCACGRSQSQPFCDGSHKGTGLSPKKTEITEAKTVAWCACKHSGNMPFCDGTHSKI